MKVKCEYELNRAWITNESDEIIGETNFVVPAKWLKEFCFRNFSKKYDSFSAFLEQYDPETEGEFIYQEAIKANVLIEDIGIVMC